MLGGCCKHSAWFSRRWEALRFLRLLSRQFSVSLVGALSIVANQALDRFFHKDFCELAALSLAHAEAWLYGWDEFWS